MLIEKLKEILQTIISENKSNYAHILQKKCNRDLIKQIYEYTCFLKEDCWKLSTRCYCIINDIDSLDKFPKCKTCGKTILHRSDDEKDAKSLAWHMNRLFFAAKKVNKIT